MNRETGSMSHSLDNQYRLAFENRKLRAILLLNHLGAEDLRNLDIIRYKLV